MSRLPEHLDPWRAADRGERYSGSLDPCGMPRLSEVLHSSSGEAGFELEFYRDGRNRACVRGRVQAVLALTCQRCLGPVQLSVDSPLSLAVVEGFDEAERLPEEYDPLLVSEGRIAPAALVEDELLLALPQVPMHSPERCDPKVLDKLADEVAASVERENPFLVLEQLKKKIH